MPVQRNSLARENVSCMMRVLIYSKEVGFKKYLHRVCNAGSRLLFMIRSGTHGLNEEMGRQRGRERKVECTLCGAKCESVKHLCVVGIYCL